MQINAVVYSMIYAKFIGQQPMMPTLFLVAVQIKPNMIADFND
jgi:hypothetical protein